MKDRIIAFVTILALVLFTAFAGLSSAGCTDEAEARRVLDDQGFTDVQTTGYAWGACSDDDTSHTGFTAKNPKGKPVAGVVCCGLVAKACTVRW